MKTKSLMINVILLTMITSILIAGLIACGGNDATNPSLSQGGPIYIDRTNTVVVTNWVTNNNGGNGGSEDLGDNNGDNGNTWNVDETKGKTFYGSSYRQIYVPFVGNNWYRVSYNDTDRLTRMWKSMIDRGRRDGQRRMYIKFNDGEIFFDEDYNMRWSKQPDVVLYYFYGGVIAQYKAGYGSDDQASREYDQQFNGLYGLGGLYASAMSLYDANVKFKSGNLNYLFGWKFNSYGHGYSLDPQNTQWSKDVWGGSMSIMMLHPGYPVDLRYGKAKVNGQWFGNNWSGTAYAMQWYRERSGGMMGYRESEFRYNIQGNTPERYMPVMAVHQLYHLGYRWGLDKTYDPNNYQ